MNYRQHISLRVKPNSCSTSHLQTNPQSIVTNKQENRYTDRPLGSREYRKLKKIEKEIIETRYIYRFVAVRQDNNCAKSATAPNFQNVDTRSETIKEVNQDTMTRDEIGNKPGGRIGVETGHQTGGDAGDQTGRRRRPKDYTVSHPRDAERELSNSNKK